MTEQFVLIGEQSFAYAPRFIAAALLLLAGWLVAEITKKWSRRFLKRIHLDDLAEKIGIESLLLEGGVRLTTTGIVANLLYWILLLGFLLAAISVLGIDAASLLFVQFAAYIPRVIVAIVVLVLGALLARFVRSASFTYLTKIGSRAASPISLTAYVAILAFSISLALKSLGIAGTILTSAFLILFGSICLAFAISFGLAGRHAARDIISRMLKK